MSKRVSSEGLKIPKPKASYRTWGRWIDPMGRVKIGTDGKITESANPMCSVGRNMDRFLKRSIVLAGEVLA